MHKRKRMECTYPAPSLVIMGFNPSFLLLLLVLLLPFLFELPLEAVAAGDEAA